MNSDKEQCGTFLEIHPTLIQNPFKINKKHPKSRKIRPRSIFGCAKPRPGWLQRIDQARQQDRPMTAPKTNTNGAFWPRRGEGKRYSKINQNMKQLKNANATNQHDKYLCFQMCGGVFNKLRVQRFDVCCGIMKNGDQNIG